MEKPVPLKMYSPIPQKKRDPFGLFFLCFYFLFVLALHEDSKEFAFCERFTLTLQWRGVWGRLRPHL